MSEDDFFFCSDKNSPKCRYPSSNGGFVPWGQKWGQKFHNFSVGSQKEPRTIILIDLISFKKPFVSLERDINYEALYKNLTEDPDVKDVFIYFSIFNPKIPSQKSFRNKLESLGYKVKNGYLIMRSAFNIFKEREDLSISSKITEIMIARDLLYYAYRNQYDKAYLLTDSNKFVDVIKMVNEDLEKKAIIKSLRDKFGEDTGGYFKDIMKNSVEHSKGKFGRKLRQMIKELNQTGNVILEEKQDTFNKLNKYVFSNTVQRKKAIVYIDYYNIKKPYSIDFGNLKRFIGEAYREYEIVEYKVFMGINYPVRKDAFSEIRTLLRNGYSIKWRFNELSESGFMKETKIDLLMASSCLLSACEGKYDLAIFLSADLDYLPILKTICDPHLNKEVHVWGFREAFGINYDFSHVFYLDDFLDKLT